MDTTSLLARRGAVLARHKTLESVPGSGWHKDDAMFRGTGETPISKRPIAIQCDDTFYFLGDCVPVVREALEEFVEKHTSSDKEPSERTAQQIHALKIAKAVAAGSEDVIELPSQWFNSCLYALHETGVKVVTTGATGDE